MELRAYMATIRKRWLTLLLSAILGGLAGTAGFLLTPRTYASTIDFYVSTPQTEGTSLQSAGQFAQSRVNSYIVLLSSEKLAKRVIAETGLDLTPGALAAKISASTELNTVIVNATVEDQSPQRSFRIAEGLATSFEELVNELDNQGPAGDAVVLIYVVSGPTLEPEPVSPDWRRYIGLGLVAGLLIGLTIAVLREVLDSSVRSIDVAQRLTGAPVIGSIPFDPDTKRSPLIIGDESTSMRAEAYRQLRTNLQFISATRSADVILLTSSVALEGKSTTAVNLALTFAEFGERVLLIEADLRRPRVADYLGLEREVGLSTVLAGQVALDDVIQPWGNRDLSLLASGLLPPNPSELLGSPQMAELIRAVKERFDKIVIDTPPVVPVTDAVVASSWADAVVLVVHHGRTNRGQVATAARALANVDARLVGTVFSKKKAGRSDRQAYGTDDYEDTSNAEATRRRRALARSEVARDLSTTQTSPDARLSAARRETLGL